MAGLAHNAARMGVSVAADIALKSVRESGEREKQICRAIDLLTQYVGSTDMGVDFEKAKAVISDKNSAINRYINKAIDEIDPHVLKMMALNLAFEAFFNGTKMIRENRERYQCNIPWLILMDPTSACNLHCTGCWAAEYGNRLNLSYEELNSVVKQGKELGVYFYMFTGGEPLVRKKDLIRLAEENNDCQFLAFTNGTLVDEAFCADLKRVGNFALAISLEGDPEVNDLRRGDGVYSKVMHAMDLLKQNGLVFGTSICYTSKNCMSVTSPEFVKLMVEKGCRYAMYFHYMPVGNDASVDLLLTPEQRVVVKNRIRAIRKVTTGEGLFTMDFQNDGEFVGGCIAGGRNYFHINANGDAEPCVFIHYSNANIRTHSLLEILKSPLFMAYRDGQPFNENQLRPCPMLENPGLLTKMVHETGAKSTDLQSPETPEHLCAKCADYAHAWQPVADRLWEEEPHRKAAYSNYKRDSEAEKAKASAEQ